MIFLLVDKVRPLTSNTLLCPFCLDICLQVPIFERMELACWWTDAVKKDFPLVLKYWETIKQRYSSLHQHINNELLTRAHGMKLV